MNNARIAATIAACVCLVPVTAGCGSSDSEQSSGGALKAGQTLKLGYAASLSGFLAAYDQLLTNGAKIAVDEINRAGGIDGKVKVELDIRDAKSETPQVAVVSQELLDAGNKILVSTCNIEAQIATASTASRGNGLAFSGCNADPAIYKQFAMYWGVGQPQNALAAASAQRIADQGLKRIYILSSPDLAYYKSATKYFKATVEHLGLEIVGEDTFQLGQKNFAPQVTKIKNASPPPDVLWSPIFAPDVGTLLKQLRADGVDLPAVGTDGWDTALTTNVGGKAAEGAVFTTHGFPKPGSATAGFYSKYEKRYGERPDSSFAAVGYNVIRVIATAVEKARSTDPEQIANALDSGLQVDSTLPPLQYKPRSHSPDYPVAIVEVKGGAFALVAEQSPSFVPAP